MEPHYKLSASLTSDVIRGLTEQMNAEGAEGRVFNVGSQAEISILDLASTIKKLTGSSSEITVIPYDEAYETGFEDMQRRRPDTTRLRELIGWEPTHDLTNIVKDVIADLEARGIS